MSGKSPHHPLRVASPALLISLLLSGAGGQNSAPAAQAEAIAYVVPGQFIAKIHTEALGRAPTPAEWQYWFETFSNSDDCEQTVKDTVYHFYTSADFFQRYPDEEPGRQREAQLLALFRGALNQELAQGALDTYMSGSWPALPFTATVSDVLYFTPTWSLLFDSIVYNICEIGDPPWYQNAPYGWRAPPVVTLTPIGPYISQTVTIPADLTAATLSFWRYIATTDQAGAGDQFSVELRDSAGRLIAEIGVLDNQSPHGEEWWRESWDVSACLEPYRGQQVGLRFQATTDDNGQATSFFVDDVNLALHAPESSPPPPPPPGGYPPPPTARPPQPPSTPRGGYPPPVTPGPTLRPTLPLLPGKPTREPGP